METKSALERLAAGEAVHPDEMTDAELLALLPQFVAVVRRVTTRADHIADERNMIESERAA